jgi:polar amino acid transport system substrate-binding protein
MVPAAIKSKGTLAVASDASYAPNEFIAPDGHTVIGMDPDLMKALAAVMGLQVKVVNVTFADIIPGMQAGKYDVGASSFTDTKEREKVVDFVTYLNVGEAFLTKTGSGVNPQKLADLCGLSVSVETGTVELSDAQAQNAKCKSAGKPAIKLLEFADQNSANLALKSNRAQVDFADSPIIAYQVRKLGVQVKSSPTFGVAPYGLALFPKGNGMAQAVLAALKHLMANGKYLAILQKWQLQSAAITNPVINGATS